MLLVMIAGRLSKTVAFVAILALTALTTFGALTTASAPTHGLCSPMPKRSARIFRVIMRPETGRQRLPCAIGVMAPKLDGDRNWTAAIALRHVANLAVAAREGIEPAPSLAHEALEVAQWASQSSAAAAIQQIERLAPIQRLLGDYAGPLIDRNRKGTAPRRMVLAVQDMPATPPLFGLVRSRRLRAFREGPSRGGL